MEYLIGFIIIIIIGVALLSNANNAKDLKNLKEQYDELLKGSDKRAALEAGRAYYSALRKPKALTIYDEQAISNDLTTMKII